MKRNAYADTTIKKVAKLLKHLKKNCNTKQPEEIKEYLEVGYEYVCQKDKLIFMRKRK